MIDTHAHLSGRFCDDLEKTIELIEKSKLETVVLAAASVEESKENVVLAKKYEKLVAAAGIHPQKVDVGNEESIDEQLTRLDELISKQRRWVKSVGECGLDFSKAPEGEENRSKEDQVKLFRGQICLAMKYKLPLMVHARKAVDEVIEILESYEGVKGVFHCYAGGKKRIKKVVELGQGWYFGIDGNITYEVGLEQVVREIPQSKLVLETDSPFLTPVPCRGEKNDPTKVEYVYRKVAEIWGGSFEETEKIIDNNAKRLFGL